MDRLKSWLPLTVFVLVTLVVAGLSYEAPHTTFEPIEQCQEQNLPTRINCEQTPPRKVEHGGWFDALKKGALIAILVTAVVVLVSGLALGAAKRRGRASSE